MHLNMHKRFLAVTIASMIGAIVIALVIVNASVGGSLKADQTELLNLILLSGGDPSAVLADPEAGLGSEDLSEDTGRSDYLNLRTASYFIASTHEGKVTGVDLYDCPDLDDAGARALAEAVLAGGQSEGTAGAYAYKELVGPSGSTYAFLNVSKDALLTIRLLFTSVGAGALGAGLVLLFAALTAARIIRPAERHLAAAQLVMDKSASETEAAADFLARSAKKRGVAVCGEDLEEGRRLAAVTGELRAVSDSFDRKAPLEATDLSELLRSLLSEFDPEFEERDAIARADIEDGVELGARPEELRRMLRLLFRNVCENLAEGGDVFVDALQAEGKAGIVVRFTARSLPDVPADGLFTSPGAREGGYYTAGLLGARLLAEENGADLRCEYLEPSDVCFTIRLKQFARERMGGSRA